MPETWVTDEQLRAELDGNRFVEIPPGEMIEVEYWYGNGTVRIVWATTKSNEGFGGLTVTEMDLRSRAHPIRQ
jgi:hypothetical protein